MEYIVNCKTKPEIIISPEIEQMAGAFFDFLVDEFSLALSEKRTYHLALSGGKTPVKIFEFLARMPLKKLKWNFLHLYWSDERCVPPNHPESNYGNLYNTILRYIDIPEKNIHRIRGEADPMAEAFRYSDVLKKFLPRQNDLPRFDLILLGIGEDGHTASIFPGTDFPSRKEFCYPAEHPVTQQKRITLSMNVINNAKKIAFLASGKSKINIVRKVLKSKRGGEELPAAFVCPVAGSVNWFLDSMAAKGLNKRWGFF